VVWDRRIPPDTRLAGSTPCLIVGVHRDHHFALDLAALIRGFPTPALCGDGGAGRGRGWKASQGGNRGEDGGWLGGRGYGDLRMAGGLGEWRRGAEACSLAVDRPCFRPGSHRPVSCRKRPWRVIGGGAGGGAEASHPRGLAARHARRDRRRPRVDRVDRQIDRPIAL